MMVDHLKQKLPNLLTVMRIAVIPMIILSLYISTPITRYLSVIILLFACLTDFLDGYLARMWQAQSKFGRLLDPIADKLIVTSTIIMLIYVQKIDHFTIIPAVIIISREILVSGLREFLIASNVNLPVTQLGRIKTTVQMVALIALMMDFSKISMILNFDGFEGVTLFITQFISFVGDVLFWLAAVLTAWSGYEYVKIGIKHVY